MSFDLPASVEREIEQYAEAARISPTEAVVKLIQSGLKSARRKSRAVAPITEDELRQFEAAFPTLGLLDDVTDEQWDRILKAGRKMSREGFPVRA